MDDEEKVVIFWIGAVCGMEGIQRGLCCEEQRLCLYHSVPSRLAPLHFLPVGYCLVLSARSVARGADAIIKLTHGHEEAHCPLHTIVLRANECLHLWCGGEYKSGLYAYKLTDTFCGAWVYAITWTFFILSWCKMSFINVQPKQTIVSLFFDPVLSHPFSPRKDQASD